MPKKVVKKVTTKKAVKKTAKVSVAKSSKSETAKHVCENEKPKLPKRHA